ncbi:MAG TPA: hypothetical protein PLC65_08630 [Bacteroidia bacterium]|nr:hypothetical protein [Bacteroidia bacterium]
MNNVVKIKIHSGGDTLTTISSRNLNTMPNCLKGLVVAKLVFRAQASDLKHIVIIEGLKKSKPHIFLIDNLLIRQVNNNVYRMTGERNDKVNLNNFDLN